MTFSQYEMILYFIEEYGKYRHESSGAYIGDYAQYMADMVYSRIRNVLFDCLPESERPSDGDEGGCDD